MYGVSVVLSDTCQDVYGLMRVYWFLLDCDLWINHKRGLNIN